MRVVFAILGAVLGLALSSDRTWLGALLGAAVALTAAEVLVLRRRLSETEKELSALGKLVARLRLQASEQAHTQSAPESAESDAQPARAPDAAASERWGETGQQPGAQSPRALTVQPSDGTTAPTGPPSRARAASPAHAPPTAARTDAPVPSWTPAPNPTSRISMPAPPTVPPAAWGDREPAPDALENAWRLVREYFTGGNTLVRVGIIVLFFGVAFLLRYLAEHSRIPIQLRLSAVAVGGIALLVLGWRLRARRSGYALALQGGGVGILYLIVFAGLRLYSLLAPGAAFALLIAIAVLSAVLAVLQDSQAFALLGTVGGFLAPILASTGEGSHVVLFSYYAVLNVGLLLIAWFKAWRPLNVVGFLFTFVIGTVWGVLRYSPELLATTEPFLILFFLFYVAIAVLFAERQPPQLRGYIDGTLVFGTPLAAFGLQSALLFEHRFALAYSALAVSALYLALAWMLHRRRGESQHLLTEAFMALGVLFLTLAVPLGLAGRWSSATWAIEGAGLVWVGSRQNRRLPRAFGAFLQVASGVIFWNDRGLQDTVLPVLNSACLGGALLSAAAVFCAVTLQKYRERLSDYEAPLAGLLFFWGLLWWLFSGLTEIQRSVPDRYDAGAGLLFLAATAVIASELNGRARLSVARLPALWLLPAMIIYALLAVVEVHHPLADGGWISWPCAFAALYFLARRHEGPPGAGLANTLHTGAAWLLIALVSWEVAWAIDQGVRGSGSWPAIAWAVVPAVSLVALVRSAGVSGWPMGPHRRAYLVIAGGGIAAYLAIWTLLISVSRNGDPYPLPFVPLLNPLDLAQLFVLLILLRYWLHLRAAEFALPMRNTEAFGALAVLGFVWLNAALLRSLHYWAGVPLQADAMLRSTLVQTSVSIFWAVLALSSMLIATHKRARVVWMTGAALLAVVILKLFLVDLSRVGTIERIVSFVVVGVLMLIVGYFSPLPPQSAPHAGVRSDP